MPNGELYHWGVKGMKWGVRRWQNTDGTLTTAGRKRYANSGYITSLNSRKVSELDNVRERKKRIDADIKEADDRVKFYGSKRAAKIAIKDEAEYATTINRGRAFMDTLKYGGGAGLAGFTLGVAAESGGLALLGLATPITAVGVTSAIVATKANKFIRKHANDQIQYTDDSEYGHDMVIALKKHDD
jgi:hypothetical protein